MSDRENRGEQDARHDTERERILRVEMKVDESLRNQEESKDRQHKLASDLQQMMIDMRIVDRKMDGIAAIKAQVDGLVEEQGKDRARITSLEDTRADVRAYWLIVRWLGGAIAAVFTTAVMVGDKVAKFWGVIK